MVSTYTANINAEQPARGDQFNTWATNPANNNSALYDLVIGGNISISISTVAAGANYFLTSSQYKCNRITFTGTLAGQIQVILPSSFKKSYEIVHNALSPGSGNIVLYTGQINSAYISMPPGQTTEIINDGFDTKFKNLDRVGSFWDYGGSSVPSWVSTCGIANSGLVIQPYLNCDGSTFSSSTYPQLAAILGSTTLPDSRGRIRVPYNQGTGRLTTAISGINGDVNFSAGGVSAHTLTAAQIPGISFAGAFSALCSVGDVCRAALGFVAVAVYGGAVDRQEFVAGVTTGQRTATATVSIVSDNTGGASHSNAQPTYVGGLTLIRAG